MSSKCVKNDIPVGRCRCQRNRSSSIKITYIYTLYSTHQNFDVSINVATELFYSTTSCTGRIKRHAAFNQNCRI